jgi:hypothetical protein
MRFTCIFHMFHVDVAGVSSRCYKN